MKDDCPSTKVRALIEVALPEDEEAWLEIALHASGSQLGRICRMFRRVTVTDDPDRAAAQQRKRRLVTWWREDGMLDIFASLPPEDGAVVLNALETAMRKRRPAESPSETSADQPVAVRRADASVEICERWLDTKAGEVEPANAPRRLVVHVDADALAGTSDGGRCHIEDGPALAAAAARRVGCDAEVETVIERGGVPIDVGRTKRVVSGRMRRLLQLRDGTCRYPGCTVPARDTEGHHIRHWIDGGETSLSNMVSLCRFHHHRHHDGAFTITSDGAGIVRFVGGNGGAIGLASIASMRPDVAPDGDVDSAASVDIATNHQSAKALDGGEPLDMAHTLWVLAHNRELRQARARPSP